MKMKSPESPERRKGMLQVDVHEITDFLENVPVNKLPVGEIPVVCDAYVCPNRGGVPRCYLIDLYAQCSLYNDFKPKSKK